MKFEYWHDKQADRIAPHDFTPEKVAQTYYRYFEDILNEKTPPLWGDMKDKRQWLLKRKHIRRYGTALPFKEPYYDAAEYLPDKHKGKNAYIFLPGPSMYDIDFTAFKNSITLGVNSAAFAFEQKYWVIFEGAYINWLLDEPKKLAPPKNRTYIMSARCAIRLYHKDMLEYYISLKFHQRLL